MPEFTTIGSLPPDYRAVVFGAGGALGTAFVEALCNDARCAVIHAGARDLVGSSAKVRPFCFDLEYESSIESAAHACTRDGPLHLILVATGMLHGDAIRPEKTWRALSTTAFGKAFAVNTVGPALIAKHLLGHLATHEKAVFAVLSARVGSIADNRTGGWHAYRASKAALNMLVRTVSIELAVRRPSAICVALHPGTVDTPLSLPFQSAVKQGSLFTPQQSVNHLLHVIDQLSPAQTGKIIAWDGTEIMP